MPGIIGNAGWNRASAWTWDFSSTHSTTAASGGFRQSPTTSKTFSVNSGSLDSLNPSARWGLSSKVRQIRPIVDFDKPVRSAIFARDQCVAFAGVDSKVATTTSSTWSTPITGGRPGRGSSRSPSRRSSTNRARHLPTVPAAHPTRAATVLLSTPSAHASTIRERNANACDDFARRDHRVSCSRSSSVNTSSTFGRPVLAIPESITYPDNFRCTTLGPRSARAESGPATDRPGPGLSADALGVRGRSVGPMLHGDATEPTPSPQALAAEPAAAADEAPEVDAPVVTPLTEPSDGVPDVVETPEGLAAVIEAFAAGTGPVAIDAERASGYLSLIHIS